MDAAMDEDSSGDLGSSKKRWPNVTAAAAIVGGLLAGIVGALLVSFVRALSNPASLLRLRMVRVAHGFGVLLRPGPQRSVLIEEVREPPGPQARQEGAQQTQVRQAG